MSRKKPVTFKYRPSQKLPKLGKIKTAWDLKRHFYKSEKDPQIERDIKKTESAYNRFEREHKDLRWMNNKKSLFAALEEYVKLIELPGSKPGHYFSYRTELNSEDTVAERSLNKLEERFTKMHNKLLFFELALAKIAKKNQKEILKDSRFASFHFYLKDVFDSAKYLLSEPEEKILNLKANTSRGLWITATQKILNKKTITFKGEEVPIHGALMQFENLPWKDRHLMWNSISKVLEEVGEVAENELVALVLDKKTDDDLRGYKKPYTATTKAYDSSDKTLENLVSVIETRGYELSRKFYSLKKKIIGKNLSYIDRNDSIAGTFDISFERGVSIVRDVFYQFNEEYGKIFDKMLIGGQIDVWPKKGKGGGAFCSSGVHMPTVVFLNHNNSIDSLRTLAHEMGHAIHSQRSKGQPPLYEGYSTLTAETASTFFESLVIENLLTVVPDNQKLALLDSFIGDKIGTMVMCIARFKFELEMHETIRREGGMGWKEMANSLSKHFADYCGPAITTEYRDGLLVVSKPHYRMNFYQYSYSFGEIASSIMRKRFKGDSMYRKEVDTFLSSGASNSVEDIFKTIGIDMSKKSTFLEGLSLLQEDINTFEQLTKNKRNAI